MLLRALCHREKQLNDKKDKAKPRRNFKKMPIHHHNTPRTVDMCSAASTHVKQETNYAHVTGAPISMRRRVAPEACPCCRPGEVELNNTDTQHKKPDLARSTQGRTHAQRNCLPPCWDSLVRMTAPCNMVNTTLRISSAVLIDGGNLAPFQKGTPKYHTSDYAAFNFGPSYTSKPRCQHYTLYGYINFSVGDHCAQTSPAPSIAPMGLNQTDQHALTLDCVMLAQSIVHPQP